jgi:hypothetical protein
MNYRQGVFNRLSLAFSVFLRDSLAIFSCHIPFDCIDAKELNQSIFLEKEQQSVSLERRQKSKLINTCNYKLLVEQYRFDTLYPISNAIHYPNTQTQSFQAQFEQTPNVQFIQTKTAVLLTNLGLPTRQPSSPRGQLEPQ